MNNEYYTKNEIYGEKFFKLPKVLFTSDLYKTLTDTQRIAYAMLKDRFSLSEKNEWFDDKGRIYFIFSQVELMDVFNCSKQKASDIKKALKNHNLIEVKKWGQGKADWIYLKRPIVSDQDVYKIKEAETVGAVETSKNQTSKSLEIRPLEVRKLDAINTDIINTDIKDTDKTLDLRPIDDINNLKLPHSLKKWLGSKVDLLVKSQIDLYELEEFYNICEYIKPNAEKEDVNYINDFEFSYLVKKLVSNTVIEKSTQGVLLQWVLNKLHFKKNDIVAENEVEEIDFFNNPIADMLLNKGKDQ
jgi:hypothetical protein